MKQIFISDLHLDEAHEYLCLGFMEFLSSRCQTADEIYILGDFFEIWLGDDHESTFNNSISEILRNQAADVFLMHGNRDFLIGDSFCERSRATLLGDPCTIETPIGRVLLMHGDSLCTLDEAYMDARKILRSDGFIQDFLSKPIAEREAFARQLRGESKAHTRETAADIMDVTQSEVEQAMSSAGVLTLIHGHTHRPAVHELELPMGHAKRYVLGDWQDSMQYLEITEDGVNLMKYELHQA